MRALPTNKPHFNLITSAETLSPSKATLEGTGGWDSNIWFFWGDIIQPTTDTSFRSISLLSSWGVSGPGSGATEKIAGRARLPNAWLRTERCGNCKALLGCGPTGASLLQRSQKPETPDQNAKPFPYQTASTPTPDEERAPRVRRFLYFRPRL